ncbi:unnamed protein product [Pipistrellus nathusii]|uniref:Uncharacterized protein n=1 Tax=Pipistrellus nathusii TaxID=59473 RepID=A0ABN9ZAA1_PIPNA
MTQSRHNIFSSPQKVLFGQSPTSTPLAAGNDWPDFCSNSFNFYFEIIIHSLDVAERVHVHKLQLLPVLTTSDSTSAYVHQLTLRNIIGPSVQAGLMKQGHGRTQGGAGRGED